MTVESASGVNEPHRDSVVVHGLPIYGVDVDPATRCAHYHGALDVIALKFFCCGRWYPCFECHQRRADHPARVWPREQFNEEAVLCGLCGLCLGVSQYLSCESRCPRCAANFNPGCRLHYHLYFER